MYGINLSNCRSQGNEGANVTKGVYGGLQALIIKRGPNADYVHFAVH